MASLNDITIKTIKRETRLCMVDGDLGYFHCWEHYATPVAPGLTIGSHPGGQVSYVNGIVEFEDGVRRVNCEAIKFVDEENQFLKSLPDPYL